ncbi:hypothetical protein RJD39_22450 (plasmid) [Vibrio scophthalmi]|nr:MULTISPECIES: hypothetical protein [Vibrio]
MMSNFPFNTELMDFQPVVLTAADNCGRDWHFDGALMGQSQDSHYDYFLYHTRSKHKYYIMVGVRIEKATGITEAENWGMIDTDMMASFMSEYARFDIFTQCQFPGYHYIGAPIHREAA